MTSEQQQLIDGLLSLCEQDRFQSFVVADRGRGKSTALGVAVAELVQRGYQVVVTASQRSQVANLFEAMNRSWLENSLPRRQLETQLRYLPPDVLAEQLVELQPQTVVLVDEAASIALPVLQKLSQHQQRLVISSTAQGYEGSGRGFYARFRQFLIEQPGQFQEFHLSQPLRWSSHCQFERFVHQAIGLFPVGQADTEQPGASQVDIRVVSSDALLADEALLRQVFGLLCEAHYQTQPNDLRLILDAPYVQLWIATQGRAVIAVSLVLEEGGFDPSQSELMAGVVSGRRRPRGNLVAQKLARESGNGQWCEARSLRVSRIAVREGYRRRGIASALLGQLLAHAQRAGIDYLGSSFGIDSELLPFWLNNDYRPVFLGSHLDKASAARNLIVLRPLNTGSQAMAASLAMEFRCNLPLLQPRFMPELPAPLLRSLRLGPQPDQCLISARDEIAIKRFVKAEIDFVPVYAALCRKWLCFSQGDQRCDQQGDEPGRAVARQPVGLAVEPVASDELRGQIRFLLERAPDWQAIAARLGLAGRREVLDYLRDKLREILQDELQSAP